MNSDTNPEISLLSAIRQGERYAFEDIYRRYWQQMYQTAFYVLKDQEQSMDIVQEIFIKLWEGREHLQIFSLRSYLINAVRYKVANNIRHSKVREDFFLATQLVEIDYDYADRHLHVSELKLLIAKAVEQLPEKCKTIFQMSRDEFLNNREIAQRLGISEKTVENQLTIAIKKLRTSLGRLYLLFFF